MRENKTLYVNVRFSEKEYEKLTTLMYLAGYKNRSRYIRESLLLKRYRRRRFRRNEANIAKQIELLRGDIKRIGVNYNQRVKALNTLASLRDKQGRAVITSHDIERDMSEMKKMMEDMVSKVTQIQQEIDGPDSPLEDDGDDD